MVFISIYLHVTKYSSTTVPKEGSYESHSYQLSPPLLSGEGYLVSVVRDRPLSCLKE